MGTQWVLGGPCLFLLLSLLVPGDISTPSTTKPQYLVMVPFLLHAETSEQICVQMSHLNESVMLNITLAHGVQGRTLVEQQVSETDFFKCFSFLLPKWNISSETFITVVAKGATQAFWSRKSVLVKNPESMVFVQTDKPIYKPGQTVQFRIVSLTERFHPLNETFPLAFLEDPKRNRLFQWRDVELRMGLIQLSFPLTSEPTQGTYKLVVQKNSGKKVEKTFAVEEYVLPKYEVLVKVPKIITIMDEEMEVTVCGVYTYGKPVPGLVNIHVCREYMTIATRCYGELSRGVCEDFSGEADGHGCFSRVVQTNIFQLKRPGYKTNIQVQGKITEEGTGMELTGSGSTEISSIVSKVTFEKVDSYYKPGIPFSGQVKLVDGTNEPLDNATIQLHSGSISYTGNYTTNKEGIARFSIDTANFTGDSFSLEARHKLEAMCYDYNLLGPHHQQASIMASRFYSPSQSYIHIESVPEILRCGQTQSVRVYYVLKQDVAKEEKIVFKYLVVARGEVVETGTHVLPVQHIKVKGDFLLDLSLDMDDAPLTRLLVYTILPSGELVAHSADFKVENCFRNKVDLQFSEPKGLPSSKTRLHLETSRASLCAIHAVDQSVYLLKPEAELSPQSVYNLLPVTNLRDYRYMEHNVDDLDVYPCVLKENIFVDGIYYSPAPYSYGEGDVYKILKDFGLKVFTSTKIHRPNICADYVAYSERDSYRSSHPMTARRPSMGTVPTSALHYHSGPVALATQSNVYDAVPQSFHTATPIRKFFPETWIWLTTETKKDQGEVDVPVTIPDTITEWRAGAFCLSEEAGFGLSQPTFLKAFQPFFMDLNLPYSVVRGEVFVLKGTVFNYLDHCIRVSISLAPSPDFDASPVGQQEESYCICANGRKTVSWTVTPKSLGEVNFTASAEALNSDQACGNEVVETPSEGQRDSLVKLLLVEPEGVEKEVVVSSLLCTTENAQTATASLKLPDNVVEDSARAYFTVLGDILGSAIQNLHQLLKMPYGCGEQNMALFAPNIYILDYLNKTDQLTEDVKSRAIEYLVAGYQRQLNYKHSDGSYSTFGERNTGNAWLTAFVLKSFAQAQRYIFVENKHILDARTSLALRQKENGCFQSTGTLLNNAIKGGVDDEITLSAYITIALLEIPLPVTDLVVRNGLFCLEAAAEAKDLHVYTQALLAYAFSLAGKEEKRELLLRSLDKEALKEEDGSIHWQRPGKEPEKVDLFYHHRAPSAEVEMTSYALLAHLTRQPAPSQEELTTATAIVKWLSKQQNPTGGFSSTQDTVVALQALSLYGVSTYAKSSAGAKVILSSGGNVLKEFQVDNSNRLLLQSHELPKVPGDYSSEVTGQGCVYMQTTLKYNVRHDQQDAPFALEVHTVPETCTGPKAHRTFDVAVNVSYIGKRPVSNMAIIDVKMLSGFIPVKASVKKLERHTQVKRTEVSTSHVLLYLDQVSNVTQSYSFTVEQDIPIQGLKPALVQAYDYYETDEFAMAEYNAPCSTDENKKGNE